jgi:hypothetical protein
MNVICPKVIHIRPVHQGTCDDNAIFYADCFPLISDPKIACLKEIRVATLPVAIQFVACRNLKCASENYCFKLKEENACCYTCDELYNLQYVSIYIKKSNNDNNQLTYLVVFIKNSELKSNIVTIICKLKLTVSLLGINDKIIHCSIFSYSEGPQFNGIHIQNDLKEKLKKNCKDFNYSISFINKRKNPQMLYINESPERVRVQEIKEE